MPWAGTKDDIEGLKRYKEERRYKNKDIKKLTNTIYNNFKEQFNSGLIIISGSIIYNALGLIDKNDYNDLDINIKGENKDGDNIILNFKEFAENCENLRFVNMHIRDDLSAVVNFVEGSIDIYRPKWNDSDVVGICEVFPNIYTQYLSVDFMAKNILITYNHLKNSITENDNYEWNEKYVKKIKKHNDTFRNLLNSGKLSKNMHKKIEDNIVYSK